MTRNEEIEIMAAELAKSEQMSLADCRRWLERGFAAVDAAIEAEGERFAAMVDQREADRLSFLLGGAR